MTILRSTTMATCVIIVASGLLKAGPAESLEEIEKLQQKRIELSMAERFTEALDLGRSLVSTCERVPITGDADCFDWMSWKASAS